MNVAPSCVFTFPTAAQVATTAPKMAAPATTAECRDSGVLLEKIVSGGQCGADRAGLDAAVQLGLATGGFMPKGFRTEDGPAPELAQRYGLQETASTGYVARSIANVDAADATVAFMVVSKPAMGSGTRKTVGHCLHDKWGFPADETEWKRVEAKHRPVFVVDASRWTVTSDGVNIPDQEETAAAFRAFLARHGVRTLNVAGHCEFAEGMWAEAVCRFLVAALTPAPLPVPEQ